MKNFLPFFSFLLLTAAANTAQAQVTKLANNNNVLFGLPVNGKFVVITKTGGLWVTGGTAPSTQQYTTKATVNVDSAAFAVVNSKLYFSGTTAAGGTELWATDGTDAGTSLVKDIRAGAASSQPAHFTVVGSTIYFSANDGTHGNELWKSDGTAGGTVLVKDINPGGAGSMDSSVWFVNGSTLLFTANDGTHGYEPFTSNGTGPGTTLLKDIAAGSASPKYAGFTAYGNKTIFEVLTGTLLAGSAQLWVTTGTAAGTTLLKDFGVFSGQPTLGYTTYGNKVYFGAGSFTGTGNELWNTDGTAANTKLFKDINPGINGSVPFLATSVIFSDKFLFSANTDANGFELWTSDGTAANTKLLKDINPGAASANAIVLASFSSPGQPSPLYNGKIFLLADDGTHGTELWATDGTAANTKLVKDIHTGQPGGLDGLTGYFYTKQGLYFSADDGSHGSELWKTDGTDGGTAMVKDINPGTAASNVQFLGIFNNHLYFTADDGDNGTGERDLFILDAAVSTLPVTLARFTATAAKQDVLVSWATSTELNTSYFNVQRSDDGKDFSTVGVVKAAGNASTEQAYSFVDANALQTNVPIIYYRLQTNDKDGKQSYSAIVPVKVSGGTITASLYPNPATDFVIVNYAAPATGKATLRIADAGGKVLLSQQLNGTGSQTSVNVKALPAGVYSIQVISSNGTQTTRFVKQ